MAESTQSFTSMAGARPTTAAPEVGIGMLGYAFMGKAHSNAFRKIPYMMYPPVAIPKLIAVCGRDGAAAAAAAQRFGYEGYYTDWRKMLQDKRIQLFDNGGPNDAHAEPCIEALYLPELVDLRGARQLPESIANEHRPLHLLPKEVSGMRQDRRYASAHVLAADQRGVTHHNSRNVRDGIERTRG